MVHLSDQAIRLRRHIDGSVALNLNRSYVWHIYHDAQQSVYAAEHNVSGDGWSELIIGEEAGTSGG